MPRFGLCGPSYKLASVNVDDQMTMNWFPSIDESGAGNAPISLNPGPGLKTFIDTNPGAHTSIRGQFTVIGRAFAVEGPHFYEILAGGTKTSRGTVSNDSLPVTMAATPQQLLLASGGNAYVFDLALNTLTQIPGATFPGPVSIVGVCDDFFIAVIANSKQFFVSGPLNANDWVTNGSAIVSVFPDNIVGMLVDHREIWFWSDTQSVVYFDSGAIFPFDVIPGAFIEAGLAAAMTPVQLNNTVMWLGSDARGQGVVWQGYGYTPQRISDHALEVAIQGYTRISDAIGFSYQDGGHQFYVLFFPTPSKTWVYDTLTKMWHERGYWLESIGQYQAAHYQNHIFCFGKHLVGDWQSGKIYQMAAPSYSAGTWSFADDAGNPIRRARRAPHISEEQKKQFFSELQVYLESGIGPVPGIVAVPAVGGSPVTTAIDYGPQGSASVMTLPVTCPLGLKVGDMGIFVIYSHSGGGFFTPRTNSITDTLGTSNWQVTGSPTLNTSKDLTIINSGTQPVASLCSTKIGTAVPPGGSFNATITMNGTLTILDVVFLGVSGVTLQGSPAIQMSILDAMNGVVSGNASSFQSHTPARTNNYFYISIAVPAGTLVSYPTGYTSIPQLGGLISAATFNNTTGASASDIWTQTPSTQYGVFQCGFALTVPGPIPPATPTTYRGPILSLRWSDDGGHKWSNDYKRDCGQAGEYKKRVRWLRLGSARNRTFEIWTADAWGVTIVDAYLKSEDGTGI